MYRQKSKTFQPLCAAACIALVAILSALAVPYVSARAADPVRVDAPVGLESGDWRLTFSDEFNGDGLDRTVWKLGDYWGSQTLSGNGEQQCYLPDSVSVKDGRLILTARRKQIPEKECRGAKQDLSFASGIVTTAGCHPDEKGAYCGSLRRFGQAYGVFEVRAKLPRGRGLWPAFWLVPSDASWPPEIDVFENIGEPSVLYHTYHFNGPSGDKSKDGRRVSYPGVDFSEDFHTYAVAWSPGRLVWYFDGREVFRVEGEHVSDKPMYILMNLAVGGYWPGPPDAATQFPAHMEIDYVRVFERVAQTR